MTTAEKCPTCGSTDGTPLWRREGSKSRHLSVWHKQDAVYPREEVSSLAREHFCVAMCQPCPTCSDPFHTQPQAEPNTHVDTCSEIIHTSEKSVWWSNCRDQGCPHHGNHEHTEPPPSARAMEVAREIFSLYRRKLEANALPDHPEVARLIQALVEKETAEKQTEYSVLYKRFCEEVDVTLTLREKLRLAVVDGGEVALERDSLRRQLTSSLNESLDVERALAGEELLNDFDAPKEVAALREQVRVLMEALDRVLTGGNHLALHIGADHPSFEKDATYALGHNGAGWKYDVWLCWRAIMQLKEALAAVEEKP